MSFEQPDAISMLIITWRVIILFAYWIVFFSGDAGFVSIPALGSFHWESFENAIAINTSFWKMIILSKLD